MKKRKIDMKKFNTFFKSKITKFVIILVVICLFVFSFYKRNKKEVKDVVLMYTKGDNINKIEESIIDKNNESPKFRDKISKIITRKEKPKKWIDTKAKEYKQIVERIRQQDKDKILEKYSFTQEDFNKTKNLIRERAEITAGFQKDLRDEYNRKKVNGKLLYGKKIKNNDYVYVAVDSIVNDKKIQKKINNKTTFFVLKIDTDSQKSFNKKLFGKRINDIIYLKLSDFLDKEQVELLNETQNNAQETVNNFIKIYPYLNIPEYRDSIKYTNFSMKFVVLDILDNTFIKNNNIENKVFDYNK